MKPLYKSTVIMILTALALLGTASAKEKNHEWLPGTVISQNFETSNNGVAVMPIGSMIAGIPIRRLSNTVVVESGGYRFQWLEVTPRKITLVVNDTVRYYRDGKYFVVLDMQNKKHKFVAIGITKL
jgi:hypothetical protein